MKKSLVLILIASFFMLGLTIGKKSTEALIPQKEMVQVGIIVEDIEQSARNWAEFLGLEIPPSISVASGHELNPTQFQGKPSTATAKLAFFNLDNITIELIESDNEPMIQHGGWGTGEYSYMDGSEKLGLVIELLEHYN